MSNLRAYGTWDCPTCGAQHNVLPDYSGVMECDSPCIRLSDAKRIDAQVAAAPRLAEALKEIAESGNDRLSEMARAALREAGVES